MNGKSIKIDNTDAEGRLILADALCYADEFKPAIVIDVATLTGAIKVALGAGAAAVFTSDDQLWTQLQRVGAALARVRTRVHAGIRRYRRPSVADAYLAILCR
jgi:leucyl aminopeptidase